MRAEDAYDVRLTADGLFAVVEPSPKRAEQLGLGPHEVRRLPGYMRVQGEAQVWLSPALKALILSRGLVPAPGVLAAIDAEVAEASSTRPWATDLEVASCCADPALYPARLIRRLDELGLLGPS